MFEIVFLANAIHERYEDFLVPFTYFALSTNPNSFVEIVVESADAFERRCAASLELLRKVHSNFLIRDMDRKPNGKHTAATYRFLEVPHTEGRYTYIMDVDVMLLESIVPHFEEMWPDNCVINNIIRPNTERLTGMHFVRTSEYYTPSFLAEQDSMYQSPPRTHENDEVVLYQMVAKCHSLPPRDFRWRPIFGIHFSPNRGCGKAMGLKVDRKYRDAFAAHEARHPGLFSLPEFRRLSDSLRDDFAIR